MPVELIYECDCETRCNGVKRALKKTAWYQHKPYREACNSQCTFPVRVEIDEDIPPAHHDARDANQGGIMK